MNYVSNHVLRGADKAGENLVNTGETKYNSQWETQVEVMVKI
ncbi:7023_t:CDS:2 [Dentiscutata erythropus]|uniref:7023_t:CDS:1 n=1 Tax=Dentiscutata erythropus TaxID=1348616 RepID=A0A9N9FPU6_9GLOM|nr:7023_t:CDS:2 [Dentiscutata erythropus]